jgi:hypothetical protein
MGKDPAIRLVLGNRYQMCSSVWRFWTHGEDAYFGARMALGTVKFSMHAGEWSYGETSESARQKGAKKREPRKVWEPVGEFTPGWVHGPTILFPWVPWWPGMPSNETPPADVVWIPCPDDRSRVQVAVMISTPGNGLDEAKKVSQAGDTLIGSLPMSNGKNVWLQVRRTKLTGKEIRTLATTGQEFDGFKGDPAHAWGMWVTTDPDHDLPLIVTFPLDRRIHFGKADG